MPVEIPKGVQIGLDDRTLAVKGPKGSLAMEVHPEMTVVIEDAELRVERPSDERRHRALHGLTRSLIANMVEGVTEGFTKVLEIRGVGYRAETKGRGVSLSLGFSHPIQYDAPRGITLECPDQTTIVVRGVDKQLVGQTAAEIRAYRPPEPYKGKGVRYKDEKVRRKAGKTAAGAGVGGM